MPDTWRCGRVDRATPTGDRENNNRESNNRCLTRGGAAVWIVRPADAASARTYVPETYTACALAIKCGTWEGGGGAATKGLRPRGVVRYEKGLSRPRGEIAISAIHLGYVPSNPTSVERRSVTRDSSCGGCREELLGLPPVGG